MKVLKKFPPGTDLRGGGQYDRLVIWGDEMATVEGPMYGLYDPKEFSPRWLARKFIVSLTGIPAKETWGGRTIHFRHGDLSVYDQDFSFPIDGNFRSMHGRLQPPKEFWVASKMSDLSPGEDSTLYAYIKGQGYREILDSRYNFTAAKWKKILALPFSEVEYHEDYDIANAVDRLNIFGSQWENLPGVFATTKKGTVKWVVTRNEKGEGL